MLEHSLSFYRARIGVEKIKGKDMLHIPFNKRGVVDTQRFSISGLPCLYLSTTSFGTWLELGLPEAEYFQVSSFKIPKDLKVLNLCIQQHTINGMSNFIEKPIRIYFWSYFFNSNSSKCIIFINHRYNKWRLNILF